MFGVVYHNGKRVPRDDVESLMWLVSRPSAVTR